VQKRVRVINAGVRPHAVKGRDVAFVEICALDAFAVADRNWTCEPHHGPQMSGTVKHRDLQVNFRSIGASLDNPAFPEFRHGRSVVIVVRDEGSNAS